MKDDESIVRCVNRCLDLSRLSRILTSAEINRFIALVDGPIPKLVFSGDLTGFHIEHCDKSCTDCASLETTQRPDFFDDAVMARLRESGQEV